MRFGEDSGSSKSARGVSRRAVMIINSTQWRIKAASGPIARGELAEGTMIMANTGVIARSEVAAQRVRSEARPDRGQGQSKRCSYSRPTAGVLRLSRFSMNASADQEEGKLASVGAEVRAGL